MNPIAPVGTMHGSIDSISDNRVFSGWVLNDAHLLKGQKILVRILREGREIGRGYPNSPRFDIVKDPDYLAGFRITCDDAVSHDDILFGRIRAEFHDCDGATGVGEIWDNVRAGAARVALAAARPMGPLTAKLLLDYLARSGQMPSTTKVEIAPPPPVPAPPPRTVDEWLLNQFESLGYNCTFGVIQSHAKAAHLGLLKFSQVDIAAITAALGTRLAGVGEAEFTNVIVDSHGEYRTSDRRYGMSAHTKIHVGEVDEADFISRQLAKIRYLVRNFLDDIEAGDRILVVHAMPDRIDDMRLAALCAAVRKIGPAPILYVEAATDLTSAGTVACLGNGLLKGYVVATPTQHFQTTPDSLASWITLCRRAYQMAFNIDDLDAQFRQAVTVAS